MKRVIAITLGFLFAGSGIATEQIAQTTPAKDTRPMLALRVIDAGTKVPRALEKNQLSLSKKHQLCWAAFNMPFKANNQVVEVFNTPDKAKYVSDSGNVVSSEDKKTHTITRFMQSENGERVSTCWQFDKNDPKGKYSVSVKVNDVQYPPQFFEIVE